MSSPFPCFLSCPLNCNCIITHSRPGRIPRKCESFYPCSESGETTVFAGRLHGPGRSFWTRLDIHWKNGKWNKGQSISNKHVLDGVQLTQGENSRLQFLLHLGVLLLRHRGFTFPQFVHFLPRALKVRFGWGWGDLMRWRIEKKNKENTKLANRKKKSI